MSGANSRGGVPVGRLADMTPIEASAVLYLRAWSDRASGRADATGQIDIALGSDLGQVATLALDRLCTLCAHHGRRPLIRHDMECACVGADESCFAQMIAAASEGAREDAMMIAMLIVRPDFAPALACLSQELGMALRRMTAAPPPSTGHQISLTMH